MNSARGTDLGLVLIIITILIAPLPEGSKSVGAIALLGFITLFGLLAIAVWPTQDGTLSRRLSAHWLPIALGAAAVSLVAVQLYPFPLERLEVISPTAAKTHALVSEIGLQPRNTISIAPTRTEASLLTALVYFSIYLLTALTVDRHSRRNLILYVIVISGVVQALLGLTAVYTSFDLDFEVLAKQHGTGIASGTFNNRNHFAGYLGLCAAAALSLLIKGSSQLDRWGSNRLKVLEFLLGHQALLRFALVIIIVGVVVSRSRMGNLALLSAISIATVLYSLRRQGPEKRRPIAALILLASIILLDILVISQRFGLERVVQRFAQTEIRQDCRFDVIESMEAQKHEKLWLGNGGDTFELVFRQRRETPETCNFDHAHNDYYEIYIEFGIIGLIIAATAWLIFCLPAVRRITSTESRTRDRAYAFATLTTLGTLSIHSTVEFNLQLPAYCATAAILLACLYRPALPSRANPGSVRAG